MLLDSHTIRFEPPLDDEEFEEVCRRLEPMKLELTKDGAINMVPPEPPTQRYHVWARRRTIEFLKKYFDSESEAEKYFEELKTTYENDYDVDVIQCQYYDEKAGRWYAFRQFSDDLRTRRPRKAAQGYLQCECRNNDWEQFTYAGRWLAETIAECKRCGRIYAYRRESKWARITLWNEF